MNQGMWLFSSYQVKSMPQFPNLKIDNICIDKHTF